MLEFIYLEGEDMLMHKVKTRVSVLCWGPFFTSKAVLPEGTIGWSSFFHMENGIGTPRSLMWDLWGFCDTEIYIPSLCLRLNLTYFATFLYLLLSLFVT